MERNKLKEFETHLRQMEKAPATVEKYLRDADAFLIWLDGVSLTKKNAIAYKEHLTGIYAARSVNAMLAGINAYLRFIGHDECCVKPLRIQRQFFREQGEGLTQNEYERLVRAAGDTQIGYVIRTICGTGIRVSELRYITAEAVHRGRTTVQNKGKTRVILISTQLQRLLRQYMKKSGITAGCLFLNKRGKSLDRFAVWRGMKRLCNTARVDPDKVFPHCLRHLFARVFYRMEKDLLRLADLLGHSSINTTRLYTLDDGSCHLRAMENVCQSLFTEC